MSKLTKTWTIYADAESAKLANMQAARDAGCNMVSTTELYRKVEHVDGRAALQDGIGSVTTGQLEQGGWFPRIEE